MEEAWDDLGLVDTSETDEPAGVSAPVSADDDDGEPRNGLYAAFEHEPRTPEALALGERLAGVVIQHEAVAGGRTNQRRGTKLAQFQEAAGRFAADLLRAQADRRAEGRCYRSLKQEKFEGAVSYRHFIALVAAMKALGLITRVPGYRKGRRSAFAEAGARDGFDLTEAKASTYTATPSFLALASAVGVTPENVGEHFAPDEPADLIVLRAGKPPAAGHKERGAIIDFRASRRLQAFSATVDAMEAELAELNEFTARFPLTGATHFGFYRTFNLGDTQGFKWNKGGRITSRGNIQTMKKELRPNITIDGKPVTEIDAEASHLTLAYGLLGITAESMRGAYEVEGLPSLVIDGTDWRRWAVKRWTTVSFGAGKPMARWPDTHRKTFGKETNRDLGKVFKPSEVSKAMMTKHPVLVDWWAKGGSWADLQYVESQALIGAMTSLMRDYGIPAFPLHDALLVRTGDFGQARETLSDHYRRLCSFRPSLVCRHSHAVTATPPLLLG